MKRRGIGGEKSVKGEVRRERRGREEASPGVVNGVEKGRVD